MGLEPTPEGYVQNMVEVFREIRRVLRPDGVLWLNLGDSYMSHTARDLTNMGGFQGRKLRSGSAYSREMTIGRKRAGTGLKNKDLVGIPWRVALALQQDGWWLRSDTIWAKGFTHPVPTYDRPHTYHEYLFLLTRKDQYFYDDFEGAQLGRSKTIWEVNPQPYKGSHFATWPEKLVEVLVRTGSSAHGACSRCGSPYRRDIRRRKGKDKGDPKRWIPTCECGSGERKPCVVLDPFSGSGTTGLVSLRLGRDFLGLDINAGYLDLALRRCREGLPLPEEDPIGQLFSESR